MKNIDDLMRHRPFLSIEEWECLSKANWFGDTPPDLPLLLKYRDKNDQMQPFLPSGDPCMIHSTGGVGKTQLVIQMAMSIATGRPLFDMIEVARPGKVLLALGETKPVVLQRRLYYSAKQVGLSDKELLAARQLIMPLPLAGRQVCLGDDIDHLSRFGGKLKRIVKNGDIRLIVLDPISRFMGRRVESDNEVATTFVQILERLTKSTNKPAILVTHHERKSGGGRHAARGSSALVDGIRWDAQLERLDVRDMDVVKMQIVKVNDGMQTGLSLYLTFADNGVLRALTPSELDKIPDLSRLTINPGARANKHAHDRVDEDDFGFDDE